jgi:quercetin dioxygenase-like cupin family protein
MNILPDCPHRRVARTSVLLAILVSAAASASGLEAQAVVPVHEEPRHRLVLDRMPIRILDVQIAPGDTSLFHTHSSAILYVTIGVSTTNQQSLGGDWGNVNPANPPRGRPGNLQYVTSYVERPLTHRVTNVGSSLFRLIAIANYGEGVQENSAAVGEPVPGTVEVETPWHRAWRYVLAPGESSPEHRTSTPVVAVQATPGTLELRPDTGAARSTADGPGSWVVAEPGSRYTLRNTGSTPLEVVVVQVR